MGNTTTKHSTQRKNSTLPTPKLGAVKKFLLENPSLTKENLIDLANVRSNFSLVMVTCGSKIGYKSLVSKVSGRFSGPNLSVVPVSMRPDIIAGYDDEEAPFQLRIDWLSSGSVVRPSIFRSASCVAFCFDTTREDSLNSCISLKNTFRDYCDFDTTPVFLIGTKVDLNLALLFDPWKQSESFRTFFEGKQLFSSFLTADVTINVINLFRMLLFFDFIGKTLKISDKSKIETCFRSQVSSVTRHSCEIVGCQIGCSQIFYTSAHYGIETEAAFTYLCREMIIRYSTDEEEGPFYTYLDPEVRSKYRGCDD